MDKRFFLALVLTMGVIVLTPRLFPGAARPVPAVVDSARTAVPPAPGVATGAVSGAAASTAAAPGTSPASTAPGAPVVPGADTTATSAIAPRTARLENTLAAYEFSTLGAALTRATLTRYARLAGDSGTVELRDGPRPLVRYRLIAGGDTVALDRTIFTVAEERLGARTRLTFTTPVGAGAARIAYTLAEDNYLLDVDVQVEGVPGPAFLLADLPSGFDTQERDSADDRRHLAYAMRTPGGGATRVDFRQPDPGERLVRAGPFTWVAAKSKYFLVALLARDTVAASPMLEVQVTGALRENKVAAHAQGTVVLPLSAAPIALELYAGPQEWERLVGMGREFEHTNPYGGWFNGVVQPFATIVMRILLWMKRTTALEYGWILVVFGVAIRLLMWPLNSKMMRSQLQMQRIAPLVQAAQAEAKRKFPTEPQKQQQLVMKVYQDAGISPFAPLAGCLPMLIPMPVLFALFFVFQNTIEFRGVPFLWFPDISVKDPFYVAPFLTGGSMFFLSWLSMRNTPPNPQTKMMAWMMPLMMTVFGLNFAAGLNLYWFVQNVAALPQQWLISNERAKSQAVAAVAADAGGRSQP